MNWRDGSTATRPNSFYSKAESSSGMYVRARYIHSISMVPPRVGGAWGRGEVVGGAGGESVPGGWV